MSEPTPETASATPNKSVRHEDFIKAVTPLLELIGHTPETVFAGLSITPSEGGEILLISGISAVSAEDGTSPVTVGRTERYPGEPGWPFAVAVV